VQRVIITGANGAGKSHLAKRFGQQRPDVPVISFDAMKLTSGWKRRPRDEVSATLSRAIKRKAWILEGGPSLIPLAIDTADVVVWLDPPNSMRAWRLLIRPWRNLGQTRSELPTGNPDWPIRQYQFAFQSLRNSRRFSEGIASGLATAPDVPVWRCRSSEQIERAIVEWGAVV